MALLKARFMTTIYGLTIQDLKSNVEILRELEKYMKEQFKIYLLWKKKDIGRDIFIYGLIMQYLKNYKRIALNVLMLFMKN